MSIHDLGELAFLEGWNFKKFRKEAKARFANQFDGIILRECFDERGRLLPIVPTQEHVDKLAHACGADPRTLCANWSMGCNGVTDGPIKGKLSLCDNCKESLQL